MSDGDAVAAADEELAVALAAAAEEFDGRVGYRLARLGRGAPGSAAPDSSRVPGSSADGGVVIQRNSDDFFPTASAIKLPVLTAFHEFVQRGGCFWENTVEVTAAQLAAGSGILPHLELPRPLSYRDAAWLMICLSDNTATNLLLNAMGIETTNRLIQQLMGDGIIVDKLAGPPSWPAVVSMGRATPGALGRFLDALAAGSLPGAAETEAVARQQLSAGGIPRYLPFGPDDESPVSIAHKNGSLAGVRTDIGILRAGTTTVTMAIMVDGAADTSDRFENEPERLIGRLARLAYDAWLAEAPSPLR